MRFFFFLVFLSFFTMLPAEEKILFSLPKGWKEDSVLLEKKYPGLLYAAYRVKKQNNNKEAPLTLAVYRSSASGRLSYDEKIIYEALQRRQGTIYCLRRENVRVAGGPCMRSIYRLKDNIFAETWVLERDHSLWNILVIYASNACYDDMKEIEKIVYSAKFQSRDAKE